MNITATIPAMFALAGALLYTFATNAKVSELGRITFACGLLVVLFLLGGHVLKIGSL